MKKDVQHVISRRAFVKSGLVALASASFGSLLVACSDSQQQDTGTSQSVAASESSSTIAAASKTLVAYFSASGNTERVANIIAGELDADIFVIEPKDPYTDSDLDWTDESSRVNVEHQDESQQNVELVQSAIPGLENYETVLFGYPTWWQQASWVVNDVATENDFSGKTVIPFTTSASSPLGTSGENLAELAETGNWTEGKRFSENDSENEIVEWVKSLEL